MNTDKVTLDKETFDQLNKIINDYEVSKEAILQNHLMKTFIPDFRKLNEISTEILVKALYIGYEQEKPTPAQQVKGYYDHLRKDEQYFAANAVKLALNLYGVKIQGINE